MKKDVNEFIRESKLNGQKSFTKEYHTPAGGTFTLTINDGKYKIHCEFFPLQYDVENVVEYSDFAGEDIVGAFDYIGNYFMSLFIDSFKEKMNEHISINELGKPFTIQSKNDSSLAFGINLKDEACLAVFTWLFEGCYGIDFVKLVEECVVPSAKIIRKALAQPKLPKEITLKSKDNRMVYNPSTRIGRYFQVLAEA